MTSQALGQLYFTAEGSCKTLSFIIDQSVDLDVLRFLKLVVVSHMRPSPGSHLKYIMMRYLKKKQTRKEIENRL